MAETVAYLVNNIIPQVQVRQRVLSFPIPLRSLFAVYQELLTPVLRLVHRALHTHPIQQIGVKRGEAASGAVTLIQRFGSAANLNLHALVLDGVYHTGEDGAPVFNEAAAPRQEQLQALLGQLIKGIVKLLTRLGHLLEEDGITREGNAVLKLKTPWRNGATHIVLTPMEFMQRLAALVPRPGLHLIRFHSVSVCSRRMQNQDRRSYRPLMRWNSRSLPSDVLISITFAIVFLFLAGVGRLL